MSDVSYPEALYDRSSEWHFEKIVEFTRMKGEIGEPSPHLAVMGHFCKDQNLQERAWRLACYAAVYCLPTAQIIWSHFPVEVALTMSREQWEEWLDEHWQGIVTRQERRAIRTPFKLSRCLSSALFWIEHEYPKLLALDKTINPVQFYDTVWDSALSIDFFGRYIAIRFIEGLRRYCDIPAVLYDMRSIGGWSPKKALSYLYPQHVELLLTSGKESNQLADELAADLIKRFAEAGYPTNYYVIAAMLCEYRGAFENRHQYPGWTIDQEPLMYDKVAAYWGDQLTTDIMWKARAAIHPAAVLGERNDWNGTRWSLAATLRDHGYNWSDLIYDYGKTTDFANPARK